MTITGKSCAVHKAAVAGLFVSALLAIPAYAKTVNYVRIEEEYEGFVGAYDLGAVDFSTYQHEQYDLEFRLLQDNASYNEGDALRVEFTLRAKEGYDFKDIKIGSCKVDETVALSELSLSEDDTVLRLSGELPALKVGLEAPSELALSAEGVASWDPVEKADYYTVTVRSINDRGSLDYRKAFDFSENRADLRDFCYSNAGDYVYTVVAKSYKSYLVDSEEAELARSRSLLISKDDVGYGSAVWTSGQRALIGGKYANDTCVKICGSWYWFGTDDHLRSGWRKAEGGWEYYDRLTHKRASGLCTIQGNDFYFDPQTGLMQTGFVNIGGNERFFAENGASKTGWVYYRGKAYYVLNNGTRNYEQMMNIASGEVYMFDPADGHLLTAGEG